ncbi:hypothetical protein PHJA_001023000 [Phtheirospermum japonicum]|uniref:S-protein homolog n=1 Tax=Phtheirospermum japonicum TaxID=374723 RepID=A0A830BY98_9LAMI|nr:hypothetical protein PHJA_001023000 [Phtheirospermum japonicum]
MSTMVVHCASGDDELGFHTLSVNEQFQWGFCPAPRTLFFCHLWWGSKQKSFDVFVSKFIKRTYDDYYWVAASDGIYLSNDYKSFTKKFDWE